MPKLLLCLNYIIYLFLLGTLLQWQLGHTKKLYIQNRLWASFTKQSKLAQEHNSNKAQMGVEISAGDLLTMRKLKNTDVTSRLHIGQRNIASAAQIWLIANKEYRNKVATVRWKEPETKNCDRAGIAWLLVEGSK